MTATDQTSSLPKGQQYNLKWTNYTNNILQVFSDHLLQESLVDVTLVCEGRIVKAHKIILSACSFYFREIFEAYTERHPLIILNGVRFADLKQLIEFMYRGEVKVQDADVEHLLQLAETLQVKGLCTVREKSGGLLQPETEPPKERENQRESAVIGSSKELKTVEKSAAASDFSSSRRSSRDSISVDLNTIKTEPGTSEDYNSGDESPLVIDESPDASQNISSDLSSSEPQAKKARVSKDVDAEEVSSSTKKVSRPPNAFMIFTNECRERVKCQFPQESNKEISVRLGNMWKNLPQATKDLYYERASKSKAEHRAKHSASREPKVRKSEASNSKRMKYYEAIQLVKLVMADEKEATQEADTVGVVDVNNITSITNGNDSSDAVSTQNK